jgi:lipopolysaccharide export system protein LptC
VRPQNAAEGRSGRSEAFAGALRHSRRVRVLKFALPVIGAVLALGFAGYSYLLSPSGISIDIDGSALSGGKLIMANPKLTGYTKENLPYSMNAARAIQDFAKTGEILLEEIDAKFPLAEDKWAFVTAASGIYDEKGNTLDITSPVTFKTTDGLTAKLKSAFVDVGSGELKTSDPVDIEQDGSRIEADSFRVLENGKVFVFEDRVRLHIDPKGLKTADAGTPARDAGK